MSQALVLATRVVAVLVLVAMTVPFGSVGIASAVEYGGFGGRPANPRADNPRTESIFVHTAEPGSTVEEGVLLVNNSTVARTLRVYAVDSTPSTGGAFACAQELSPRLDVGSWILLEIGSARVEPAGNVLVPFKISVPENADVGEHNGCIIVEEARADSSGTTPGASLSFRTGLRVAMTVPGELERRLSIAGFSVSPTDAGFNLHPLVANEGNVSVDADVRVVTSYFFGKKLFENGGQYPVLRGASSDWNFELARPFWGGLYRSEFTVSYDGSEGATVGVNTDAELVTLTGPTTWFFSFPTPLGAGIELGVLAALAAALAFASLSRRRSAWIRASWVPYEVGSGEDIVSIASSRKVSWKIIARANHLKPPYAIKQGETIRIPPKL